jgi:hypothetical protein
MMIQCNILPPILPGYSVWPARTDNTGFSTWYWFPYDTWYCSLLATTGRWWRIHLNKVMTGTRHSLIPMSAGMFISRRQVGKSRSCPGILCLIFLDSRARHASPFLRRMVCLTTGRSNRKPLRYHDDGVAIS